MSTDVVVIISTYNGSKNIERQLDSIFNQTDVNVSAFVRDDCSTDRTIDVINRYVERSGNKIDIVSGENEGYAKSFWDALRQAPKASFYAFSDQDDVWNPNKLAKCISAMDRSSALPQLAYCKMTRTDQDLKPLDEQVNVLRPQELSKKLVLTQTYNYGAATVINQAARKLTCRHFPYSGKVPHDAWIGLLCYWFGEVHYVDEALYNWIRYDESVTGEGTKLSGIKFRVKETISGKTYYNISSDLLDHYSDLLTMEDRRFLTMMRDYRSSKEYKTALLSDKEFKRNTLSGTLLLKYGILTNRL